MSGSSLRFCGSCCGRMAGCRIWRCTMPANESWPKPSIRARWNASSRFGPTTPVVFARASVWQEPHLATNCCLPLTTLVPWLASEQPCSAAAAATSTIPVRTPPVLMERGILTAGPDVRRRARQTLEFALGGRDHGPCHALPGVVLAGGGHDGLAGGGAQLPGRGQPGREVVSQLADRAGADPEGQPRDRLGR